MYLDVRAYTYVEEACIAGYRNNNGFGRSEADLEAHISCRGTALHTSVFILRQHVHEALLTRRFLEVSSSYFERGHTRCTQLLILRSEVTVDAGN